jgi:hypothetical protein
MWRGTTAKWSITCTLARIKRVDASIQDERGYPSSTQAQDTPINTIPVRSDCENQDTFDIPYRIARFFYAVGGPINKYGEGNLQSFCSGAITGTATPLEFVLFDANSCTIVKAYSATATRGIRFFSIRFD